MATERDVHDARAVDDAAKVDHDSVEEAPGRDGGPQDEADMRAAEGLEAPPDTKRRYEEMLERGAHQEGEGRVP